MERMCVCGKKFITYPSRIKKGFGNFCSIKCYAVPVEIRFWKYIRKTDFCWEWIGYKDKNGYGRISKKRRFFSVHRISWELHNGKIPDGLCVLHSCDNPSCVNPDHLFLGSFQNNSNDCVIKGRRPSKLKKEDIPIIKNMISMGFFQKTIADKFDVNQSTISLISSGKNWGHVQCPPE